MEWQPIETAPKDGTLVYLKSDTCAHMHLFEWRNFRWETTLFAIMRTVDGWWSEDVDQPTHWRPSK